MMRRSRLLFLLAGGSLLLLAACAQPQSAAAVDCRGAVAWCGVWIDEHGASAMSRQDLSVPLVP